MEEMISVTIPRKQHENLTRLKKHKRETIYEVINRLLKGGEST